MRTIPAARSHWTLLRAHCSALWNPPAPALSLSLQKKKKAHCHTVAEPKEEDRGSQGLTRGEGIACTRVGWIPPTIVPTALCRCPAPESVGLGINACTCVWSSHSQSINECLQSTSCARLWVGSRPLQGPGSRQRAWKAGGRKSDGVGDCCWRMCALHQDSGKYYTEECDFLLGQGFCRVQKPPAFHSRSPRKYLLLGCVHTG